MADHEEVDSSLQLQREFVEKAYRDPITDWPFAYWTIISWAF